MTKRFFTMLLILAPLGCGSDSESANPTTDGGEAKKSAASPLAIALITTALNDVSALASTPSPAHDALRLAIWSDKGRIDPAEIQRLDVLWGRHFGN